MRVWLSPRPQVERGPSAAAQVKRPRHNTGPNQPLRTPILARLIIPVIVKDSLAQIIPADTAIGRQRQPGRRMPRQPRPPGATPASPGSRASLTIMVNDSLARIDSTETAIGPPSTTAPTRTRTPRGTSKRSSMPS